MQKKIVLIFVSFILFILSGCMEHVDLPVLVMPTNTPLPQSDESSGSVDYNSIKETIRDGIKVFGGNILLYRNVVSQCLFEKEQREASSHPLSRIDGPFSFYIEKEENYHVRYGEIVQKVINTVMPRGYSEKYNPYITEDEDTATFLIYFTSEESFMGTLLSESGAYGIYITGRQEENIIKRGLIYVMDYESLKRKNPSLEPSDIWTIVEAVLVEEMTQTPIACQDTSLDPTMRFYDSPKIKDYLQKPDLTERDFAIIKIALKLPPGTDKGEWKKIMDEYEGG